MSVFFSIAPDLVIEIVRLTLVVMSLGEMAVFAYVELVVIWAYVCV